MYPCLLRYSTDSLRSPSPERRGGQGVRTGTERARASPGPVGQCLIASTRVSMPLGLLDRLRRLVPRDRRPPKIRLVGHVTGERGVVAEHYVLDHGLPGSHRLEEVPEVRLCHVGFGTRERHRLREGERLARLGIVLPVPLLLVRLSQGARVAARVIARLRILPVLRRERQRMARDLEHPLRRSEE